MPLNPHGAGGAGILGDALQGFGEASRAAQVDALCEQRQREEVCVRVGQAGQDIAAFERVGCCLYLRPEVVGMPHPADALLFDQHGGVPGVGAVGRVDVGVSEKNRWHVAPPVGGLIRLGRAIGARVLFRVPTATATGSPHLPEARRRRVGGGQGGTWAALPDTR